MQQLLGTWTPARLCHDTATQAPCQQHDSTACSAKGLGAGARCRKGDENERLRSPRKLNEPFIAAQQKRGRKTISVAFFSNDGWRPQGSKSFRGTLLVLFCAAWRPQAEPDAEVGVVKGIKGH